MDNLRGFIKYVLITGLCFIVSGCVSTDLVQQMIKDIDSLKTTNKELLAEIDELDQRVSKIEVPSEKPSDKQDPEDQSSIEDLLGLTTTTSTSVPETTSEVSHPSSISGEELYSRGQSLYSTQRYREATMAFSQAKLLDSSPEFQARCEYWSGECMYAQGAYERAFESFADVFVKYGSTSKAADALLKIGFTYYEMHNYNGSRQALTEFIKRYPDHRAVSLAEEKLRQILKQESGGTSVER